MNRPPFFMVYGLGQRQPTVRHKTRASAALEAERLARAHPGVEFYVLRTVSVSKKTDVITEEMSPWDRADEAQADDDGIPF